MVNQDSKINKNTQTVSSSYIEAVGRRKESVARVRIKEDHPSLLINNKPLEQYFSHPSYQAKILTPLKLTNLNDKFAISIKVKGGGLTGQAEAIRLGLSRCLVKYNPQLQALLRSNNLLTRDSRHVERKKYGLKKARRAPQWQKR